VPPPFFLRTDEPVRIHIGIDTGPHCVGEKAQRASIKLKSGEILMLENLRFHPEEEKNDEVFASRLASLADIYVNEAFSVSHRAHASVSAITRFLQPAAAGLLMQRELESLDRIVSRRASAGASGLATPIRTGGRAWKVSP